VVDVCSVSVFSGIIQVGFSQGIAMKLKVLGTISSRFATRRSAVLSLAGPLLLATAAYAGALHTWSQNDALTAADLNANFSALAKLAVVSKTANYTLLSTDDLVLANGSSGAFTLTLPAAAAANAGKIYRLKRTDNTLANVVGIATSSGQTIDGQASLAYSLNTQNEEYELASDGLNWQILAHKTATPFASYSLQISASNSPPTKGTATIDSATWRRVGDSIDINYTYEQSAGSQGSEGSGVYLFSLPASISADPSKIHSPGAFATGVVGAATALAGSSGGGVGARSGVALCYDATHLSIMMGDSTDAGEYVAYNFFNLRPAGLLRYSFHATVPVAGWTEENRLATRYSVSGLDEHTTKDVD
jgi:hypothetical protein